MPDRADILEGLRRSGRILEAFVRTIPAEHLNRIRAEGCWSIAEHVSHLAQVQPMLLERVLRFMREDQPAGSARYPSAAYRENLAYETIGGFRAQVGHKCGIFACRHKPSEWYFPL